MGPAPQTLLYWNRNKEVVVNMPNPEYGAAFSSVEERRQTLLGKEKNAQRAMMQTLFRDNTDAWVEGWIETGDATLFSTLLESNPPDEELRALVLNPPERNSEEEKTWAQQIYDRVENVRGQRDAA